MSLGEGAASAADWFDDFDDFVRGRSRALVAQATAVVKDGHAAEDAVAEALRQIWASWPRVRLAGSPDAYVRRIVLHECFDLLHRASRMRELPVEPTALPEGHTGDDYFTIETCGELVDVLRRLPRQQQRAVTMRHVELLEYAEIAAALEISEGTVRFHVSRGLERMRTLLQEG